MELFGTDWYPNTKTYKETPSWEEEILVGPGGVDQVIETSARPNWTYELDYTERDRDVLNLVWAFWQARRGGAEKFYYYSFNRDMFHVNLACWTSNGTDHEFTAPLMDVNETVGTPVLYENGVAKVRTTDWDFNGYDATSPFKAKIHLTYTPSASKVFTLSCGGRRLCNARFDPRGNPMAITIGDIGYAWNFRIKETT